MEENTSSSLLKVQVYSGNDAFPVEGARVIIRKDKNLEAFLITDETGSTPFIRLSSPEREESLDPLSKKRASRYEADIFSEGFYPLKDLYISQVGGTSSVLKVNLVPIYEGGK